MKSWVGGLTAVLLPAALFAAGPAFAQDDVQVRTELSAADVMAIAERAEAANDTASAIAAYTALANDPDMDVRNEARFRHGRLLVAGGDLNGAALLYRRILDEKPDAARVRIELAAVLARIGDEAGARRELRQAQATGLPADVSLVVDQFANALRAQRPFGGSLSFALVPDSNINRATRRETLDTIIAPLELSEDAREQSGIGARVGGQGYARLPLAPNVTLLPRLSAQAELYRQSQFNDISATAAVGLDASAGRNRIRPTLAHSWRLYGGDLYARTATASVNWVRPLGSRAQIDATATAARSDYQLNDLQDGWLFDLSTGYERAIDARSGAAVTLSLTRQTARDPGYSTVAGGINLLYGREIGRASLFGTLGARRLEADERLFLYPERRREWLLSAGAGGTFRHITFAGFSPLLRVSFERNSSTIGIYDYSRVALDFGITRAF